MARLRHETIGTHAAATLQISRHQSPTNLQRNLKMKRILAAVSFAVLATPAFAVEISAPYEDTQNDRVLPNIQTTAERSKASNSSERKSNSKETNPWANDYNFIAPAL
jgi:hypothetical protein